MKKRFFLLLLAPLMLSSCDMVVTPIDTSRQTGEIAAFNLLTPSNGFITSGDFSFTWEAVSNADYYNLEIASTTTFVTDDEDEVYVRETNISQAKFDLTYSLPKKDILYYWRVTAYNADGMKRSNTVGNFFYESDNNMELPIEIEDAQDWVLHKQGSYANISIDRSNFFGNGKNSLAIVFDKEHTLYGDPDIPNSRGWIVVTKTEDRELYGTDTFYFNFYYSGHDATVLVRVLDHDGEYWHCPVKIAANSKQTIIMPYSDFELRTATGSPIGNQEFDWQHIRYFEIVFERTFGDGVCLFSDIKAVKYDNYKHMFMDKMNFNRPDIDSWSYENYNFPREVSEDGSELTIKYSSEVTEEFPAKFNGYGYQGVYVYQYLAAGDALRMQVKYTGTGSNANFYFRITEEDNDRWQFKVPFSYLVKDDYKEIVIPLKAFQRMEYMNGDGAKQFYYIQKFHIGLADNYSSGSITIKDLEVVKISNIVESQTRVVGEDGLIEDFDSYDLYTQIYYYWDQSSENKDEAMDLDKTHKAGDARNKYCGKFAYKADMEMATYQIYLDTKAVQDKNAFSIWLKDATPKDPTPRYDYLDDKDVAAEMTIQLTLDTGEWYRYVIDKVAKEWSIYTIMFDDFILNNASSLYHDPNPIESNHIIHMAFGFKYLYYDKDGNHVPTYAIANPVYLDQISLVSASKTNIEEMSSTIKEDEDCSGRITIETFEDYLTSEDLSNMWSIGSGYGYELLTISEDVSSEGGNKSLDMQYKGYNSVSYIRNTQFAKSVTAHAISLDIKGDGKATVYVNLNWRVSSSSVMKMRYTLSNIPTEWTRIAIGLGLFKDVNGSSRFLLPEYANQIESISFGIVNNDNSQNSHIQMDNIRYWRTGYGIDQVSIVAIDQEAQL